MFQTTNQLHIIILRELDLTITALHHREFSHLCQAIEVLFGLRLVAQGVLVVPDPEFLVGAFNTPETYEFVNWDDYSQNKKK